VPYRTRRVFFSCDHIRLCRQHSDPIVFGCGNGDQGASESERGSSREDSQTAVTANERNRLPYLLFPVRTNGEQSGARMTKTKDNCATLTFRAAAPQDVTEAVPLIYSSGPSTFDYVFDTGKLGGAQGFLSFAFLNRGGEFGWGTHHVGEVGGRVAVAGAVFDGRAVLRFTIASALLIFRFYGPIHAWGVMLRGLRTETVIRPPHADEYYVCHLGVREELRGQGIGARFVRHLLDGVDNHRHRSATLDVAVTNPRAQLLYERLGFAAETLRASKLKNARGRVPDHYRMSRPVERFNAGAEKT
jgi:ribosomal protein S18 acetylase RimI-like enzyme